MNYTPEEIIDYVAEEDVKFIRLAFCDINGIQKNVAITPSELISALKYGVCVNADGIDGLHGDIVLKPDASTLAELPWRPQHGRVVHFFCDVFDADGAPVVSDPRYMLKSSGKTAEVRLDQTFYLLKLSETGEPTGIPHDGAGYLDIAPADKGENVRREICLTLERMGIRPLGSRHEHGPGQHTVLCAPADALRAADNAVTFRAVVRTIAAQYGLFADFSPEPVPSGAKNSLILTVNGVKSSVSDTGKNPYKLILESL